MIRLLLVAMSFSLTPGAAALRLNEFGTQSRLQLVFNFSEMAGVETNAVEGDMEPIDALNALIAGTGITYRFVNARTLTFMPPVAKPRAIDAWTGPLIAEECQLGLISAARAEALLGLFAGRCWCCTKYGDVTDDNSFCVSLAASQSCSIYDNARSDIDVNVALPGG